MEQVTLGTRPGRHDVLEVGEHCRRGAEGRRIEHATLAGEQQQGGRPADVLPDDVLRVAVREKISGDVHSGAKDDRRDTRARQRADRSARCSVEGNDHGVTRVLRA
jgi:hypothetical protein